MRRCNENIVWFVNVDIVFIDDVPNVFATAFQRCPLDFGMEEFAQARETPIKH